MACPNGHELALDELEPRTFSFNSPFGACPVCDGLGTRLEVDEKLVIPDEDAPLIHAIAPWDSSPNSKYFVKLLTALAEKLEIDPKTPWKKLSKKHQKAVLQGHSAEIAEFPQPLWPPAQLLRTLRGRDALPEAQDGSDRFRLV